MIIYLFADVVLLLLDEREKGESRKAAISNLLPVPEASSERHPHVNEVTIL